MLNPSAGQTVLMTPKFGSWQTHEGARHFRRTDHLQTFRCEDGLGDGAAREDGHKLEPIGRKLAVLLCS